MFASEKRALGVCDRCGLSYPLKELKYQVIRQRATKWRVCRECLDKDHPQLMQGTFKVFDPQAVKDPRPENNNDRTLTPAVSPTTGNFLYK